MDRHIPNYPIRHQPANHMALQSFQNSHATGPSYDARAPRPVLKDIGETWEVVNVPNAPAHVSTHRGQFPKRQPISHPATIIRHDFKGDIKRKAAKLREEFPEIIRSIKKPTTWDDLYYLWDAADIQTESPDFLYYVLHCIGAENEQLDKESDARRMKEIDSFAGEWIAGNSSGLLNVTPASLFNIFCTDEDISELKPIEKSALQTSLRKYHALLVRNTSYPPSLPRKQIVPPHSVPQSSYGRGNSASTTPRRRSSDDGQNAELASNRSAMPLAVQSQSMSNLKLEHTDVLSVVKSKPQALDNLAESQRTTASTQTSPADISAESPQKSDINASVCQAVNRVQPVENLRRQNSWARHHGHNRPTRSGSQHQNSDRRAFSANMVRESPSNNKPQELIYLHNTHRGVAPTVRNESSNMTCVSSFNDARNTHHTTNTQAMALHDNLDFGLMEGDPKLRKCTEFCVYQYRNSQPLGKTHQGRTLFVSGPSWESFVTHEVEGLFSECGPVESIRYLLKGQNSHGPMFITFVNDVLEVAINRFDGYIMPDGYKILAKYPRNDNRDRSSSQSSFTSYNGDGQSDVTRTPKQGYVGRSQSRRPSVSNQSSRSPSGAGGLRYLNGSQLPTTNGYRHPHPEFQPSGHMNSLHYQPGQYSPQAIQGVPFRSMMTEVVQHEMGMRQFQRQVPVAPMHGRPNTEKPRQDGFRSPGSSPQQWDGSPRPAFTTQRGFNNFKENFPMKHNGPTPTSPAKDTNTVPGRTHTQQRSRKNTTILSAPLDSLAESSHAKACVTPNKKPTPGLPATASLDPVAGKLDENASCSNITDPKVEPGLEKPNSMSTSSLVVHTDHQHNTRTGDNDTKGPESFATSSQPKNKNTKKQRYNKKSANRIETNGEASLTTMPTTLSPTDTENTSLTIASKEMSIDREPNRKSSVVSVPQAEPSSSIENSFSGVNSDTVTSPAALKNEASSGNSAEKKKPKQGAASDKKSASPSTEAVAKTGHKKTGGSSGKGRSGSIKDDKKQKSESVPDATSIESPAVDSARKADVKLVVAKNKCDNTVPSPKELDQKSKKAKPGSVVLPPENRQETISPVPGSFAGSTDWPVLAPTKSSKSIIADGNPPQVPSVPALNYRKAAEAIAPALPVAKPRHSS